MLTLKNIVVGLDYSAHARAALQQAKRLAGKTGARVHAIHVVESLAMADLGEVMEKTLEQISVHFVDVARGYITKTARDAGFRDGEVAARVEVGAPLPAINRLVEDVKAELLIIGRTGSSGGTSGMGGLAFKCVRATPTRVLALHGGEAAGFRRVVAATDFSEHSRAALREAVGMAKLENAELHVLHVRKPEVATLLGDPLLTPPVWVGDQKELDAAADRMARRKVDAELMPLEGEAAGVRVMRVVTTDANAANGIQEYVRSVGADVVVMGTLGRSGLKKLLLGSTAERVLREGTCAVLAIKPEDDRGSA